MRRQLSLVVLAARLAVGWRLSVTSPAAASCTENHFTLYVDWFGNGSAQTFCTELTGNLPNLATVPGTCSGGSWNDCASSIRVSLAQNYCLATYVNANYVTLMKKYWGPMGPDTLDSLLSPNDALSSVRQYQKSPPTPAGNC